MSEDVFTQDQESEESVLDALVGEDKKFKDVESLAKGKAEADAHIAKLEQEAAERQEQLEKLRKEKGTEYTVADLMKAVQEVQANKGSKDGENQVTVEELQEVVKSLLVTEKEADTKAANRAKGNELVLSKVDGNVEAAKALVADKAAALGMAPSALAKLSEDSPDAFATLMGFEKSSASNSSITKLPGHQGSNLDSGPVLEVDGHKTKSYFDAKRKEMGTVAFLNNKQLQKEMIAAADALGLERFNQ